MAPEGSAGVMTVLLRRLLPDQHLESIFELEPELLHRKGIKGIITDMDNTLVPWNDRAVYPQLARWLEGLKEQGFRLCIVSNSNPVRGEGLAEELGIPAIWYAAKPRRSPFRKALRLMGLLPGEAAVIGDQIFTDVLGGNRLGLYTILVTPISDKEFVWTRLMRRLERFVLRRMREKRLVE